MSTRHLSYLDRNAAGQWQATCSNHRCVWVSKPYARIIDATRAATAHADSDGQEV